MGGPTVDMMIILYIRNLDMPNFLTIKLISQPITQVYQL